MQLEDYKIYLRLQHIKKPKSIEISLPLHPQLLAYKYSNYLFFENVFAIFALTVFLPTCIIIAINTLLIASVVFIVLLSINYLLFNKINNLAKQKQNIVMYNKIKFDHEIDKIKQEVMEIKYRKVFYKVDKCREFLKNNTGWKRCLDILHQYVNCICKDLNIRVPSIKLCYRYKNGYTEQRTLGIALPSSLSVELYVNRLLIAEGLESPILHVLAHELRHIWQAQNITFSYESEKHWLNRWHEKDAEQYAYDFIKRDKKNILCEMKGEEDND